VSFISSNKYQHLTDDELVQSYKYQQNMDALGALYQRYMDLLYGVCLKYLKDTELAKDAVLQVYEELVVKLPKHDVENFRAWVHTVTKNHCLMYLRSPKNKQTVAFMPELMQNEQTVHLNGELDKEENYTKLEKCMQLLVNEQQTTIQMFYYEQKCYKDIADITGFEVGTVRSFIQNGRRNLKNCMEKN
jgi:RNA polymerase sigma factor (sigma-70 family)